MRPAVLALFATQRGLITRSAALDLGVEPSEIARLLRSGEWVRVRRGVYADGAVWAAATSPRERHRLRARAAVLSMNRGWVLSHHSAAHEHGLEVLAPDPDLVHITRPGHTNAWTKGDVKHHLARYRPAQVEHPDGLPALAMARTAVDIARELGFRHGLVACDSALRRGVSRGALVEAYEVMRSWPGVTVSRDAVDHADAGAANPAESLGRELVLEAGLGSVETQFPVWIDDGTGRRVAWVDMVVGAHVIEVDGRVKYRPRAEGGYAGDDPYEVAWEQNKRQRLVCGRGSGCPDWCGRTSGEPVGRRPSGGCVRSTPSRSSGSAPRCRLRCGPRRQRSGPPGPLDGVCGHLPHC